MAKHSEQIKIVCVCLPRYHLALQLTRKNSRAAAYRTVSPLARCTTRRSVLHSVCVPVRKTGGDIFHTPHIKARIFDLEYRRPRQSCWKRHSPIYKQGLSAWDVLQEGWSRARECVCGCGCVCVGGRVGVGSPSAASRAEWRVGAHISLRWPLLSLEMHQVGVKVFFFFCFFKGELFVFPRLLFTGALGSYSRIWLASANHSSPRGCRCPTPF